MIERNVKTSFSERSWAQNVHWPWYHFVSKQLHTSSIEFRCGSFVSMKSKYFQSSCLPNINNKHKWIYWPEHVAWRISLTRLFWRLKIVCYYLYLHFKNTPPRSLVTNDTNTFHTYLFYVTKSEYDTEYESEYGILINCFVLMDVNVDPHQFGKQNKIIFLQR